MTEKGSGTALSVRTGEGSGCGVVPMARFTGVTKPAATKGPATAPIVPGVAILARPGVA